MHRTTASGERKKSKTKRVSRQMAAALLFNNTSDMEDIDDNSNNNNNSVSNNKNNISIDSSTTTTRNNKNNNDMLTEFIKDGKWNEALSFLTDTVTTPNTPSNQLAIANKEPETNSPKKQEIVITSSSTTTATISSSSSTTSSSIIINALQKNAPIKLLLKLINHYKTILFQERHLLLHEICSNNIYYDNDECHTLHETLLNLDEQEFNKNNNYVRATLTRDVDGQVPLHILIRRIFECNYLNLLKKRMNVIELYIHSCPKSCEIADYRDYEETPLVLLLKVNTYRTTTNELVHNDIWNYVEIEQLVLRILKCMLTVNPNSGCTISHVFQYTPLHSAVYHGRCYEIIKLLVDNYNTILNTTNNTTSFQFVSTRYETPLHFAAMRNENERIIQLLTDYRKYNFLKYMQYENDGLNLSPLYWLWIRFISNSFSVVNATSSSSPSVFGNVNEDDDENSDDNTNNDIRRHSFPFPYDGLPINERNDYINLSPQKIQQSEGIDIEYYNWIQAIDPSEDYRHMRFIPNHYNDINEPSAKFITRVLIQIQQKIHNTTINTSFSSLQQLYEYHNLSDIEIKIVLFWRKVLFFFQDSDITTTHFHTDYSSISNSNKNSSNKRQKIDTNNNILHTIAATKACPISIFKIAYSLYPKSIQHQDAFRRLPLHYACMLYYNPTTSLFTNQQQQRQWYTNNSNNQYAIFQQSQQNTNEDDLNIINYIALKYPQGIKIYDTYYRLPIHYALENINSQNEHNFDYNYIFYSTIIYNLIASYPTCLERRDGIFKLYPFMIVATSSVSCTDRNSNALRNQQQQRYNHNDIDHYYDAQVTFSYELLRMCPILVSTGIIE